MKFIKDYQALLGFVLVAVMFGYTHLESREFRAVITTELIKSIQREHILDEHFKQRYDELNSDLELLKDEVAQIREEVL